MRTVKDVEAQVEDKVVEALKDLHLLPDGYRCTVRFHGKSRDKKRTADFEKSWSPDTDSIHVRFERASEPHESSTAASLAASVQATKPAAPTATNPLSDLIRALDRAETQPGYKFVALKWFRDTALPSEGLPWTSNDSTRREVLRDAIDRRLVLTNRVPNPKSPQFPVTAIRLNRLMPDVNAILGSHGENVSDFRPVPIRGENLSATVLGDRR